MPDNHPRRLRRHTVLTRDDLPATFTPDTLRGVPLSVLRQASQPGNGVLDATEQAAFDAALRELMAQAAGRVRRQVADEAGRTWPPRRPQRGPGRPMTREERAMDALARRVEERVDAARELSPGVDWSFLRPALPDGAGTAASGGDAGTGATAPTDDGWPAGAAVEEAPAPPVDAATVDDLAADIAGQVELVQIMGDIADVGRRTYDLEQQREASSTRSAFFGVLVSVAVIAAGWAPLVMATPAQRRAIGWLTLATCAVAGAVYAAVRAWQTSREAARDDA